MSKLYDKSDLKFFLEQCTRIKDIFMATLIEMKKCICPFFFQFSRIDICLWYKK